MKGVAMMIMRLGHYLLTTHLNVHINDVTIRYMQISHHNMGHNLGSLDCMIYAALCD